MEKNTPFPRLLLVISWFILGNVTICLDVDNSIPQDETTFPVVDFCTVSGSTLSVPLQLETTLTGTQYCGVVSPFQTATFIPVRRTTANIVPSQSTTATATATTTSISEASSSGQSIWITLLATFTAIFAVI